MKMRGVVVSRRSYSDTEVFHVGQYFSINWDKKPIQIFFTLCRHVTEILQRFGTHLGFADSSKMHDLGHAQKKMETRGLAFLGNLRNMNIIKALDSWVHTPVWKKEKRNAESC